MRAFKEFIQEFIQDGGWIMIAMVIGVILWCYCYGLYSDDCEAQGKYWHCYNNLKLETCHCLERAP